MKFHYIKTLVALLLVVGLLPARYSRSEARAGSMALMPRAAWHLTASPMSVRRTFHTLSVLPDGNVLAAGGYYYEDGEHFLRSSEIYSALTNNWAVAANMNNARRNHTATVLLDGRVLVTGGENGTGALSSAEIFDPETKSWGPATSMSTVRVNHTATRLHDGRILVVGGCGILGCSASAEIYDPGRNTWTGAGSLTGPREKHTATLLNDGSVLVAGGYRSSGTAAEIGSYRSAYRYYPETNSWVAAGSMVAASHGRSSHNAVRRRDGTVLVVGGYYWHTFLGTTYTGYLSSTEVYNPDHNSWTDLDRPIAYERQLMAGVLDAYGNYILIGGDNGVPAWDVEFTDINDPADTWHAPVEADDYLNTARKNAAAVILPGGAILVSGGSSDTQVGLASAETTHTRQGVSASLDIYGNPAVNGLFFSSATLTPNGDIMITGGSDQYNFSDQPCSNRVYLWDHESETITDVPVESNLKHQRCGHTTTLLPDGRIVVLGGTLSIAGTSSGPGEIYDNGQWSLLTGGADFGFVRTALLRDGKILIVPAGHSQPYLFDPATLGFRRTNGSQAGSYSSFTMTLLKDGRVLIAGSLTGNTVEIFDPQTELFSPAAAFPVIKNACSATLLPDGRVLFTGGRASNGIRQNSSHIYDPISNSWSAVGTLMTARQNHSAALLPGGQVVVLGGQSNSTDAITSIEIFDPLTYTWSAAGNLVSPRFLHSTLLASNGKLVTIGGADIGGNPYDTTEMFAYEDSGVLPRLWRPVISTINCLQCDGDKRVEVTGNGFTRTWEGSSGATAQSAANQPLVQIFRLDNQQMEWLNPGSNSSDTRFLSAPIPNFPNGPVIVFLYENGSVRGKVGFLAQDTQYPLYFPLVVRH